jgi:ribosomal protein S18 acetylase RimI-like enzyme
MNIHVRQATREDEAFLQWMLYYASHMDQEGRDPSAVLDNRAVAKYVVGWGRSGDLGVLAVDPTSGRAVGAAWLRLFSSDDPGFGYLDESTPELAIAVLPGLVGGGIGTRLLERLLALARARYAVVSLSVRESNPAVRLYERFGFKKVVDGEVGNRAGGISITMRLELR